MFEKSRTIVNIEKRILINTRTIKGLNIDVNILDFEDTKNEVI
jgi:hypothetical protein